MSPRWFGLAATAAAALLSSTLRGEATFTPPPIATDPAWFDWYNNLLQSRLDACPVERTTNFHFAADGDDVNGDGSIASPFQNLAKAQEILDANPAGDFALLFKRGDIFRARLGIIIEAPNVTIGAYGTGERPVISGFEPVADIIDENGSNPQWTRLDVANAPNVWSVSVDSPLYWIRDTLDDLEDPYVRCFAVSEVEAPVVEGTDPRGRAFWYDNDTGTLHVRTPNDDAPPPTTLEACVSFETGVKLRAHGTRVDNLCITGWGMEELASQEYCVRAEVLENDAVVVSNVHATYSSSHVLGQWSASCGIVTFIDCKADFGLANPNSNAPTLFNSYADLGGQEVIFERCEVEFAGLPEYGRRARIGRGFFSHTRGPFYGDIGLLISRGCVVRDRRYGCENPSLFASAPVVNNLEDVRAFTVDEVFEGGLGTGKNLKLAPPDSVRLNSRYLNMRFRDGTAMPSRDAANGWAINCTFELDFRDQRGTVSLWDRPRRTGTRRAQLWNCAITAWTEGALFRIDRNDEGGDFDPGPCGIGTCPCDRDGDGSIFISDLLDFLSFWFIENLEADENGDGIVNIVDLLEFLECWLTGDVDLPAASDGGVIVNSVLTHIGPTPGQAQLTNGLSGLLQSNAYYGFDPTTYDEDPDAITLAEPFGSLICGSPLDDTAGELPGGILLGFDQTFFIGPRGDIGPIEIVPCADLNLDGGVDITDLLLAVEFWVDDQLDLNDDDTTDIRDLLIYIDRWLAA